MLTGEPRPLDKSVLAVLKGYTRAGPKTDHVVKKNRK